MTLPMKVEYYGRIRAMTQTWW